MGSFLDLAVAAVAVLVFISMAALAWTLGVSITGAMRRGRASIVRGRVEMAVMERKLRAATLARQSRQAEDEGDR